MQGPALAQGARSSLNQQLLTDDQQPRPAPAAGPLQLFAVAIEHNQRAPLLD